MPVIIPYGIEAVTPLIERADESRILGFVFGDDKGRAARSGAAHRPNKSGVDVLGGSVEDLLGSIEAQAVQVELIDPIRGVGAEKFPHGTGILAVKVDRLAPFVLITI